MVKQYDFQVVSMCNLCSDGGGEGISFGYNRDEQSLKHSSPSLDERGKKYYKRYFLLQCTRWRKKSTETKRGYV